MVGPARAGPAHFDNTIGDSYADTENIGKLDKDIICEWYEPYGMTFPKKPAGWLSDGRILTDYVGQYLWSCIHLFIEMLYILLISSFFLKKSTIFLM